MLIFMMIILFFFGKNKINNLIFLFKLMTFFLMTYFLKLNIFNMSLMYNFFFMSNLNKIIFCLFLWIFFLLIVFFLKNFLMFSIFKFMMIFILLFSSVDLIFFFFSFFELSAFPLFFLILIFGLNPERLNSFMCLYMYMYMSFLPSLWMMLIFMKFLKENKISVLLMKMFFFNLSFFILFFLILTFLVKIPCYIFHSWLPKAHTESPVMGSMILASIYLKMGSLGLIKMENLMNSMPFSYILSFIFFGGGMISSVTNSFQSDSKRIIAVSSIVHLSLFIGVFFMKILSDYILILLIIGHSLVSLMLFSLNYQNYKKFSSRSMIYFSSLIFSNSTLSIMIISSVMMNFSFPGMISFWSELISFSVLLKKSFLFLLILIPLIFFILLYSINLMNSKVNFNLNYISMDMDKFSLTNNFMFFFMMFPIIFFLFLF